MKGRGKKRHEILKHRQRNRPKRWKNHLRSSTAHHVKAVFHSDGVVEGQRQRQGRRATPGSPLQRPPLHAVRDEILVLQPHLPAQQVEGVAQRRQGVGVAILR